MWRQLLQLSLLIIKYTAHASKIDDCIKNFKYINSAPTEESI